MKSSWKLPTFAISACLVFLFFAFLLFVFESSVNGLVLVELVFGWIPFGLDKKSSFSNKFHTMIQWMHVAQNAFSDSTGVMSEVGYL
jgi:hypothetical protein